MTSITTSTGATIRAVPNGDESIVLLSASDVPEEEIGRFVEGHFQPILFCPFAMSPESLRAIATLIEATKETNRD